MLATSPVALYRNPRELPLDLVQRVLLYVEDVADLARITRTSRLFYYMALPRLYERTTLKSYPELRYIDGEPEGYGGGSPFSMGLLGLVTKNVAGYVKHWKVTGEWRERDVEEFLRGRIPDCSMMLTVSIRAAMDRMTLLESFWWDMNAKPMSTLYQGLTLRKTLTSLRIKSPTQRIIRPTTVVPPIPSLKELWLSDVDPLCYPDDYSFLLLHAKKLEKLNLHWSPRMREEGEPTINLHTLFGKCSAANYKIPIKELGLMNMYTPNQGELNRALDETKLERVSFINCVDAKNPRTVFFDQTWMKANNEEVPKSIKMMRGEGMDRGHVDILSKMDGLEEFYLINRAALDRKKSMPSVTQSNGISPSDGSSGSPARTPYTPTDDISLAADYLVTLRHHHCSTLRKVLLSDQWALSEETVISFVQVCPQLEQFGFAIKNNNLGSIRRLMPHAPKLEVIRLLHSNSEEMWQAVSEEEHILGPKIEFAKPLYHNLRCVGFGHKGYALGPVIDRPYVNERLGINEKHMRVMKSLPTERLQEIELWSMDVAELL